MDCPCFDMLFSKKYMRERREAKYSFDPCATCGKMGGKDRVVLRRCTECKLVLYCSHKCQKRAWKEHKPICSPADGKGMTQFVGRFINNPLISHYTGLALTYLFKLHEATAEECQELAKDTLYAEIDIAIEPRDVRQLMDLVEQMDAWNHEGVEGIVQISDVRKLSQRRPPQPSQLMLERKFRSDMDNSGLTDYPIVAIEYMHNSLPVTTQILGLYPQMAMIAKEKFRLDFRSVVHPLRHDAPLNLHTFVNLGFTDGPSTPDHGDDDDIYNLINHINEHIRFDEKNKFKLRTPMNKRDKGLIMKSISDTIGGQFAGQLSPAAYFAKMLREPVYNDLRLAARRWELEREDALRRLTSALMGTIRRS